MQTMSVDLVQGGSGPKLGPPKKRNSSLAEQWESKLKLDDPYPVSVSPKGQGSRSVASLWNEKLSEPASPKMTGEGEFSPKRLSEGEFSPKRIEKKIQTDGEVVRSEVKKEVAVGTGSLKENPFLRRDSQGSERMSYEEKLKLGKTAKPAESRQEKEASAYPTCSTPAVDDTAPDRFGDTARDPAPALTVKILPEFAFGATPTVAQSVPATVPAPIISLPGFPSALIAHVARQKDSASEPVPIISLPGFPSALIAHVARQLGSDEDLRQWSNQTVAMATVENCLENASEAMTPMETGRWRPTALGNTSEGALTALEGSVEEGKDEAKSKAKPTASHEGQASPRSRSSSGGRLLSSLSPFTFSRGGTPYVRKRKAR